MYCLTKQQYAALSIFLGNTNCKKCNKILKLGRSAVPSVRMNVREENGEFSDGGLYALIEQICECGMKDIILIKMTNAIKKIFV